MRTIRYYEELGLISPSGHSSGGFRLYGEESLKRLEVISFLKGLDLSLTEIRQIFQARRGSAGGRQVVVQLREMFAGKLKLIESKLEFLNRMKSEISTVLNILESCRSCEHRVLLDSEDCGNCRNLPRKEDVPELFNILLLQKSSTPA